MKRNIGEEDKQLLASSKSLSRLTVKIDDDIMSLESAWCRVASSNFESLINVLSSHTFYELHCVIRGSVTFSVADTVLTVGESEIFIIPPLVRHATKLVADNTEKFVFGFNITSDKPYIKDALHAAEEIKVYKCGKSCLGLIETMLDFAAAKHPASTKLVSNLCECLLVEFFHQVSPAECREAENLQSKSFESDIRVMEVRRYISENIEYNISYIDVAAHVSLSARQLNRVVKAQTGYTVEQLINIERVKYIKKLLRSKYSLSDIAEVTGFSTEYALNRFFKRMEGISIGFYRKDMEK